MQTEAQRDYLLGALVGVFMLACYFALRDPPPVRPPPTCKPGVMSLDPTDIRAAREQAMWL